MVHERGECCWWKRKWYGRRYCKNWNNARAPIIAEPHKFDATQAEIENLFIQNAQAMKKFMLKID